jgi:diguanylate cyclase (GGDEF)-like protein
MAAVAERLRATVAAQPIVIEAGALDITISVGAATATPSVLAADRLSRAADRALYRAKAAGRDRVELAGVGDA